MMWETLSELNYKCFGGGETSNELLFLAIFSSHSLQHTRTQNSQVIRIVHNCSSSLKLSVWSDAWSLKKLTIGYQVANTGVFALRHFHTCVKGVLRHFTDTQEKQEALKKEISQWTNMQQPYVRPREMQAERLSLEWVNGSVSQYWRNLTNSRDVCAVTSLAGGKLSTTFAKVQQLLLSEKFILNYWRLCVGTWQLLLDSRRSRNFLFKDFKWTCVHMWFPSRPLSKYTLVGAKCYNHWTFLFHRHPTLEQKQNFWRKENDISPSPWWLHTGFHADPALLFFNTGPSACSEIANHWKALDASFCLTKTVKTSTSLQENSLPTFHWTENVLISCDSPSPCLILLLCATAAQWIA